MLGKNLLKGKPRRRLWWIVGAVVLLLIGVRIALKAGQTRVKAEVPIAVRVQTPRAEEVFDLLPESGTITAQQEANAYSKVPGKLNRYVKSEGDRVAKDEVLAWVERDEIGLTYELSPVRAPIAGLVGERFLEIGAAVSPGGTPVALVVNPRHLEVEVHVVERDLARVAAGQPARIRVQTYPGETFPGQVTRVSPVVDRNSRTSRVLIGLEPNDGKLRSGMFADVEIVVGHKPRSLTLPQEALLKQNQRTYVYLLQGDRVARREVAAGWPQGDRIELLTGLTPQDRVVVEGQTRLTENSRVQAVEGE